MKQKVTLKIEGRLLRGARALAARQGSTFTDFLLTAVEEIVEREQFREQAQLATQQEYDRAKASALALMQCGLDLGGRGIGDRDALHDRIRRRPRSIGGGKVAD